MAWKLYCNVEVTRRQSMCHVVDAEGVLKFSATYVAPCIEYLLLNEINEFEMHGQEPEQKFRAKMHPV